jgi:cobalt-zinc-cadmium efflux system protein
MFCICLSKNYILKFAGMEVKHSHNHAVRTTARGRKELIYALSIVLIIMVVEVIGGFLSNSLALLSDSAHMLVDALAIGLAVFAINVATRPATPQKTFGYHRVEIMVALINGTILVILSLFIFYEAYQRFLDPPQIQAPIMLLVAVIGLIANMAGIFLLREVSKVSLNVKAAFWHILGDTISSAGVIAAAVIVMLTNWRFADAIMAGVIGCIIIWGAIRLIRESVDILLEAVPRNINIVKVVEELKNLNGVTDVHDVHIWAITSGIYSLSAHVLIQDQTVSNSEEIVKILNSTLSEKFNITHTTLQLECRSCSTDFSCTLDISNKETSTG